MSHFCNCQYLIRARGLKFNRNVNFISEPVFIFKAETRERKTRLKTICLSTVLTRSHPLRSTSCRSALWTVNSYTLVRITICTNMQHSFSHIYNNFICFKHMNKLQVTFFANPCHPVSPFSFFYLCLFALSTPVRSKRSCATLDRT